MLHYEGHSDLDGRQLAHELKNLPDLPSKTITQFELLEFIYEKDLTNLPKFLDSSPNQHHSPCDRSCSREELFKIETY